MKKDGSTREEIRAAVKTLFQELRAKHKLNHEQMREYVKDLKEDGLSDKEIRELLKEKKKAKRAEHKENCNLGEFDTCQLLPGIGGERYC